MDKNNELYEKALDVSIILGISPLKLMTCKNLTTTFDLYKLMDPIKQKELYDYKKLEYYEYNIEDYLKTNFYKEYEEENLIKPEHIKKMALLLLYNFDANIDFNTLVGNTVKKYLTENNIV